MTLEQFELLELPDLAWADYQRDKNSELLATRHAQFFRAIFVPSLASALSNSASSHAFADGLEQKLRQRLAEQPAPMHSFVQVIVLAKQDGAVSAKLR